MNTHDILPSSASPSPGGRPDAPDGGTEQKRLILAGGRGLLGSVLTRFFQARGCEIVVLTRSPGPASPGVREIYWDGTTVGEWARTLAGAWAVINLAGRSVDCRYHERNRQLILQSRLTSTRVLGQAIAQCEAPPAVWLNSSTATIYRHHFGPPWDENGEIAGTPEAKDEFSVEVAKRWEAEQARARTPKTRQVALRTAMVLTDGANSVFPVLRRLVRLGLGGRMGDGRQQVSWIHALDFCRAMEWILTHEALAGPINVAAPHPLSNAEMMASLRAALGRAFGLPAPASLLEVGAWVLRTETELIIKSRCVGPRRLLDSGFEFRYPRFKEALENLCPGH